MYRFTIYNSVFYVFASCVVNFPNDYIESSNCGITGKKKLRVIRAIRVGQNLKNRSEYHEKKAFSQKFFRITCKPLYRSSL